METLVRNPLFWATLGMFTLTGACSVVGSKKVGRHPALGWIIVLTLFAARFILALPLVTQPRLDVGVAGYLVGMPLFLLGLYLALAPVFVIRPLNVAEKNMELRTSGLYALTRNPIYLGELLWCLGWSVIHGSIIGMALVPVWWMGFLFLVFIEEESLERALGEKYLSYKKRIKGRIIPGLPF